MNTAPVGARVFGGLVLACGAVVWLVFEPGWSSGFVAIAAAIALGTSLAAYVRSRR